jgi:hypothetical protein
MAAVYRAAWFIDNSILLGQARLNKPSIARAAQRPFHPAPRPPRACVLPFAFHGGLRPSPVLIPQPLSDGENPLEFGSILW